MSNPNQQQPNKNPAQTQGPKRGPDVLPDDDGDRDDQPGQKKYMDDTNDEDIRERNGRSNNQRNNPGKPDMTREPRNERPRAAKGDDDLMSKQQGQAMPSTDSLKGKWKQQVGAAKIAWGKLTEDELLKSEGHEQKLAGLVQERYAITRDEAEKQVKNFVQKLKH